MNHKERKIDIIISMLMLGLGYVGFLVSLFKDDIILMAVCFIIILLFLTTISIR